MVWVMLKHVFKKYMYEGFDSIIVKKFWNFLGMYSTSLLWVNLNDYH